MKYPELLLRKEDKNQIINEVVSVFEQTMDDIRDTVENSIFDGEEDCDLDIRALTDESASDLRTILQSYLDVNGKEQNISEYLDGIIDTMVHEYGYNRTRELLIESIKRNIDRYSTGNEG